MTPHGGRAPREAWVYAAVAAAAFLPFLRGVALGHAFYFRDLSRQFFPMRRFVIDGLRAGELRFWNPYVMEGEPVPPPISYPLDLVQALLPHEAGLSLLLALHVPFAAVVFMLLARKGLGVGLAGAAAGGIVYGLGSFTLSCLNLYVYVQVVAWAPLVVLGLLKAADGHPRGTALAALATAVCLSTMGAELAIQAVFAGLLLAWRSDRGWRAFLLLVPLVLAAGLVAPTVVTAAWMVNESARAGGLPTEIALGHAVHPFTFLQTVIAHLYGDPANIVGRWWGHNFFQGFPYFLSLYVGWGGLCLAAAGLAGDGRLRWRLMALLLLGLFVCLGPWAGLTPIVEALPVLRRFRFPSKAFFSVHLALALLAALGVDGLARGSRQASRVAGGLALAGGLLLIALSAWPAVAPASLARFADGFFEPSLGPDLRRQYVAEVLRDAAVGGSLAVVVGLLALAQLAGGSGRAWPRPGWACCWPPTWSARGPGSTPWSRRPSTDPRPRGSSWASCSARRAAPTPATSSRAACTGRPGAPGGSTWRSGRSRRSGRRSHPTTTWRWA